MLTDIYDIVALFHQDNYDLSKSVASVSDMFVLRRYIRFTGLPTGSAVERAP